MRLDLGDWFARAQARGACAGTFDDVNLLATAGDPRRGNSPASVMKNGVERCFIEPKAARAQPRVGPALRQGRDDRDATAGEVTDRLGDNHGDTGRGTHPVEDRSDV